MLRTLVPSAALVLLPPGGGAARIAFAPAANLELTKRFQISMFLELDELSILAGGVDVGDMLGDFEIQIGVDTNVEVLDTYVRSAEGRPTELTRLYDEILIEARFEYTAEYDSGDVSESPESDLEGETVIFRWDAEEGAYTTEFAGHGGDARLLDGLIEDMDLRAFLPPDDVAVDDEWKVAPGLLGPVLAPGGALGLLGQDMDEEALERFKTLAGAGMEELVDSLLAGEVVCTYTGAREVEGRELATVEIDIDIDSSTDLRQHYLDFLDGFGEGPPADFDLSTADLEVTVDGTGLLEWDVAGGHFHRFEANADSSVAFRLVASREGESADVTVQFSGSIEVFADVVER